MIEIEFYDSPAVTDIGRRELRTLTEIVQDGFSGDGVPTAEDAEKHVLDVDDRPNFTLSVARLYGEESVGFASSYTAQVGGTETVYIHGIVLAPAEEYRGAGIGGVLLDALTARLLQKRAVATSVVWGRTQSVKMLQSIQGMGGYPRMDEPTPERLLQFVQAAAEMVDPDVSVDEHVVRGTLDDQLYSDEDFVEWGPQIERLLDGESFLPGRGDVVIFVAETSVEAVWSRLAKRRARSRWDFRLRWPSRGG